MTLHTPVSDVQATLTFTGSAEALLQILAKINGQPATSTVSAAAVAEASTPKATEASTATTATSNGEAGAKPGKSRATNAAATTEPASSSASTIESNSSVTDASPTSDTKVETDAAGNAGSENAASTDGAGDTSQPIAYEDISKATLDLVATKGRDAAVNTLAKFGAKNGQELKPAQYADYLAEVAKAKAA
ncbi:hypothetical protein [Asticcacaulis sp.]|uniref:hypothetical protein n=1 Tax=Asticcacaulis sp. TaxID=1872648 RepID=UPI0031E23635